MDEGYAHWKSIIPALYDWLANHKLAWPSLSCRWGPQLEQGTTTNLQRLYFSEQTEGDIPNSLVVANCEVVKPRVIAAECMTQFSEEEPSPFVKNYKTIIHPGEVNRIKELPQDSKIVATHSDGTDVFIWDIEAQPDRQATPEAGDSLPNLILTGHQDEAEFGLAMSPTEPFVLSGGKDKLVVLWSIQDHVSTLSQDQGSNSKRRSKGSKRHKKNPSIEARGVYKGHQKTVEDVAFCPTSAQEFCSVGDDSYLILWDARAGFTPSIKVKRAHNADIHCVDWNPHESTYIITGSADNTVRMFDCRKLISRGVGSPVNTFESHSAAILCLEWSPDKSSVFASSSEDGILNIWDYEKIGKDQESDELKFQDSPPGLFFRHTGHRDKVIDFHWNAADPWTIVSLSDDCTSISGGGTVQIWRMLDLIYMPQEEVLAELEELELNKK